jgi:hypothetical protein
MVTRRLALIGLASIVPGLVVLTGSRGQDAPRPDPDRQVTIFGIVASNTDPTIDPKLNSIAAQLQRLRPEHGFWLRGVASRRLAPGGLLTCDVGDGLTAEARLMTGHEGGKLRLEFTLKRDGVNEFSTAVTTPPNQLFFIERPLPNGPRLLIGIGAR